MVFDLVDTAGDERDAAMPYHVGDESGLFVRRLSRFGFDVDSEGPAVRKAPQNVADAPFLRRERDVAAVRLLDPHVPVLEGEDTVISEVLLCEVMWVV